MVNHFVYDRGQGGFVYLGPAELPAELSGRVEIQSWLHTEGWKLLSTTRIHEDTLQPGVVDLWGREAQMELPPD